jgi:hypothetical protein
MGQLFRYETDLSPKAVANFHGLVLTGARKLATQDIRDLADLLHDIARDRHDLSHALHACDPLPACRSRTAVWSEGAWRRALCAANSKI